MMFKINDCITFTYNGNQIRGTIFEIREELITLDFLSIKINEQWFSLNTTNHVPFLLSEMEDVKLHNDNNHGDVIIRKSPKKKSRKIVFDSNNSSLSKETSENIKRLVQEEIDKNGYKRDKDPFIIEMRKIFLDYGIEPKF